MVGKEFKNTIRSIVYLVFVAALAVFYVSQYFTAVLDDMNPVVKSHSSFTQPVPGMESYGWTFSGEPDLIMANATVQLVSDYINNSHPTYPAGFVRYVRLNEKEQTELAEIIHSLTGIPVNEAVEVYQAALVDNTAWMDEDIPSLRSDYDRGLLFNINLTYTDFLEKMEAVDSILGGSSKYAKNNLIRFSETPKSYDQALAEYNTLRDEDMFTRYFARVFCDSMAIAIALFSVFVPVAFLLRDRRAHAEQLVFVHSRSTVSIIFARYLGCLAAVFLPVLLLALVSMAELFPFLLSHGYAFDPFAYLFYSFTWLLPTTMVCCSVGFFFSTLTGSPIGIAVQVIWSFVSLNTRALNGDYEHALIIRYNGGATREVVMDNLNTLVHNRISFTILALVLLGFSAIFYDLQRRGKLDVSAWFRRRPGSRRSSSTAAHRTA